MGGTVSSALSRIALGPGRAFAKDVAQVLIHKAVHHATRLAHNLANSALDSNSGSFTPDQLMRMENDFKHFTSACGALNVAVPNEPLPSDPESVARFLDIMKGPLSELDSKIGEAMDWFASMQAQYPIADVTQPYDSSLLTSSERAQESQYSSALLAAGTMTALEPTVLSAAATSGEVLTVAPCSATDASSVGEVFTSNAKPMNTMHGLHPTAVMRTEATQIAVNHPVKTTVMTAESTFNLLPQVAERRMMPDTGATYLTDKSAIVRIEPALDQPNPEFEAATGVAASENTACYDGFMTDASWGAQSCPVPAGFIPSATNKMPMDRSFFPLSFHDYEATHMGSDADGGYFANYGVVESRRMTLPPVKDGLTDALTLIEDRSIQIGCTPMGRGGYQSSSPRYFVPAWWARLPRDGEPFADPYKADSWTLGGLPSEAPPWGTYVSVTQYEPSTGNAITLQPGDPAWEAEFGDQAVTKFFHITMQVTVEFDIPVNCLFAGGTPDPNTAVHERTANANIPCNGTNKVYLWVTDTAGADPPKLYDLSNDVATLFESTFWSQIDEHGNPSAPIPYSTSVPGTALKDRQRFRLVRKLELPVGRYALNTFIARPLPFAYDVTPANTITNTVNGGIKEDAIHVPMEAGKRGVNLGTDGPEFHATVALTMTERAGEPATADGMQVLLTFGGTTRFEKANEGHDVLYTPHLNTGGAHSVRRSFRKAAPSGNDGTVRAAVSTNLVDLDLSAAREYWSRTTGDGSWKHVDDVHRHPPAVTSMLAAPAASAGNPGWNHEMARYIAARDENAGASTPAESKWNDWDTAVTQPDFIDHLNKLRRVFGPAFNLQALLVKLGYTTKYGITDFSSWQCSTYLISERAFTAVLGHSRQVAATGVRAGNPLSSVASTVSGQTTGL